MKRVALTDGSGQWFDSDKAEKFSEKSYWNGNNHISKATGSQWEHESVYLTKGGKWILNHWSQHQGSRETYEVVSDQEASEWFARQEFSDEEIPAALHEGVYGCEIL